MHVISSSVQIYVQQVCKRLPYTRHDTQQSTLTLGLASSLHSRAGSPAGWLVRRGQKGATTLRGLAP
jgi:hypothetical protein